MPVTRRRSPGEVDWTGLERALREATDGQVPDDVADELEDVRGQVLEATRLRWLADPRGGETKLCPRCGQTALEGEAECGRCGGGPYEDRTWRRAGERQRGDAAETVGELKGEELELAVDLEVMGGHEHVLRPTEDRGTAGTVYECDGCDLRAVYPPGAERQPEKRLQAGVVPRYLSDARTALYVADRVGEIALLRVPERDRYETPAGWLALAGCEVMGGYNEVDVNVPDEYGPVEVQWSREAGWYAETMEEAVCRAALLWARTQKQEGAG